ncbi:phosphoribosyltransferase [Phormidium tenue FACHB-886]|nr:phosphoribosyltransferase [Phormidium tenue FACHB-886]
MQIRFRDRQDAGQQLAAKLSQYANRLDVLVLALPRGGVPVAYEIAQELKVPLDICLVRKLGVPGQEELAMGAIATGDILVLNQEVLQSMDISRSSLVEVAAAEKLELERRQKTYRGDRLAPEVSNHTVILVDDGIATGSTLRAAIAVLQQQNPREIIVAVPVAPPSSYEALKTEVSEVVSLLTPTHLNSIGQWYRDFSQTSDEEVCRLLEQAAKSLKPL